MINPVVRISPLFGLLMTVCPMPAQADDPPAVAFEQKGNNLLITIGGKSFATYAAGDGPITRPFFKHLHAPNGTQVTRSHPPDPQSDLADHPTFHPGLWMAFGDVNGADFWRNKDRIRHVGFLEGPRGGPGRGSFAVKNQYESGADHRYGGRSHLDQRPTRRVLAALGFRVHLQRRRAHVRRPGRDGTRRAHGDPAGRRQGGPDHQQRRAEERGPGVGQAGRLVCLRRHGRRPSCRRLVDASSPELHGARGSTPEITACWWPTRSAATHLQRQRRAGSSSGKGSLCGCDSECWSSAASPILAPPMAIISNRAGEQTGREPFGGLEPERDDSDPFGHPQANGSWIDCPGLAG